MRGDSPFSPVHSDPSTVNPSESWRNFYRFSGKWNPPKIYFQSISCLQKSPCRFSSFVKLKTSKMHRLFAFCGATSSDCRRRPGKSFTWTKLESDPNFISQRTHINIICGNPLPSDKFVLNSNPLDTRMVHHDVTSAESLQANLRNKSYRDGSKWKIASIISISV